MWKAERLFCEVKASLDTNPNYRFPTDTNNEDTDEQEEAEQAIDSEKAELITGHFQGKFTELNAHVLFWWDEVYSSKLFYHL